jgi:hypothetical protein
MMINPPTRPIAVQAPTFTALPKDLKILIFSFLDNLSKNAFSKVCRDFHNFSIEFAIEVKRNRKQESMTRLAINTLSAVNAQKEPTKPYDKKLLQTFSRSSEAWWNAVMGSSQDHYKTESAQTWNKLFEEANHCLKALEGADENLWQQTTNQLITTWKLFYPDNEGFGINQLHSQSVLIEQLRYGIAHEKLQILIEDDTNPTPLLQQQLPKLGKSIHTCHIVLPPKIKNLPEKSAKKWVELAFTLPNLKRISIEGAIAVAAIDRLNIEIKKRKDPLCLALFFYSIGGRDQNRQDRLTQVITALNELGKTLEQNSQCSVRPFLSLIPHGIHGINENLNFMILPMSLVRAQVKILSSSFIYLPDHIE